MTTVSTEQLDWDARVNAHKEKMAGKPVLGLLQLAATVPGDLRDHPYAPIDLARFAAARALVTELGLQEQLAATLQSA